MTHLFDQSKTLLDSDGLWLCLRVKNRPMARKFTMDMKQGRTYDADVKLHREKRSLDANAYAWVLLGKLAAVIGVPKEQIYRETVRCIGDNFEIIPIRCDAVDKFVSAWERNGIGWVCDRTGSSKLPGYENIIAYYGSSTYDKTQMSRLIDLIVQECREQDIETMTPEELSRLKGEWNEPQEQTREGA